MQITAMNTPAQITPPVKTRECNAVSHYPIVKHQVSTKQIEKHNWMDTIQIACVSTLTIIFKLSQQGSSLRSNPAPKCKTPRNPPEQKTLPVRPRQCNAVSCYPTVEHQMRLNPFEQEQLGWIPFILVCLLYTSPSPRD